MSHSKFSGLNSFQDLRIGRIAMFSLNAITHEGVGLAFNHWLVMLKLFLPYYKVVEFKDFEDF